MDGAFCEFSEIEKTEYLERLQKNNVVNIEMESLAFAALTYHAGIKCAIVCVTYLDRLKHDQVSRRCEREREKGTPCCGETFSRQQKSSR